MVVVVAMEPMEIARMVTRQGTTMSVVPGEQPPPPQQQQASSQADLSDPFAGMSMASAGSNEAKYNKGEDVIYLDGAMNSW